MTERGYGSIIYNDIDLSGATYGLRLESAQIPGFAVPKVDVQPIAYGGGITQGQHYEPMSLEAVVTIIGSSESALRSKIEAIAKVFDVDSDKPLVFEIKGWANKRWKARLLRPGTLTPLALRGGKFRLEFIAANPIAEARTATTIIYDPDSDAYTCYAPVAADETIGGNYYAVPVWTIKGTGDNAQPLQVKNVTRDEEIVYNGDINNGHWLEIDTLNMTVKKSTDAGSTWTSAIGSCDTGPFPVLTDGVRNEILLTGLDDATVDCVYRERYLGG